jgi:putative heme-binding domain-containing protein
MGQLAAPELVKMLERGEPHEQLAAAEALAKSGSAGDLPALWNALPRKSDRMLEHALAYAIYRLANRDELELRLTDADARVKATALLLLDQLNGRLTNSFSAVDRFSGREFLHGYKMKPVTGEIPADAQEILATYERLLAKGDANRGRMVFLSPNTACATCHAIGANGGTLGPDLTKIGAIRAGRDILESILFPSATFAQGYQAITIALSDGDELQGIPVRESPDSVWLRDARGAETPVRKGQISELRLSTVSLMPSGLEQGMTREEFADLLAYLQSLK